MIYKISKYLDQLLRPFAHEQMTSVLFKDDIEFMQKLNVYVHTNRRLTSTTLFCTIDIVNYWTLDTHENIIDVVCKFIQNNVAANKLQKISIATIKKSLTTMSLSQCFLLQESHLQIHSRWSNNITIDRYIIQHLLVYMARQNHL